MYKPGKAKIKYKADEWLLAYTAIGFILFIVGLILVLKFLTTGVMRYQFLFPVQVKDPGAAYFTSGGLMLAGLGFSAKHIIGIIKDYKHWKKEQHTDEGNDKI